MFQQVLWNTLFCEVGW